MGSDCCFGWVVVASGGCWFGPRGASGILQFSGGGGQSQFTGGRFPEFPCFVDGQKKTIDLYAVQCEKCFKWRLIPSQEEYESIRRRFVEEPFCCDKKKDVSCEDDAVIEYDASRVWVIDRPNLPNTPAGFKSELVLRKDLSKLDAQYMAPNGKRIRAPSEVEEFKRGNPEYEDLSVSEFLFTVPKLMEDTLPPNVERKHYGNYGNKKIK